MVGLISNYYLSYLPREQMGTKLIVPINNIAKKSRSRRMRNGKKEYIYGCVMISLVPIACVCVCVDD